MLFDLYVKAILHSFMVYDSSFILYSVFMYPYRDMIHVPAGVNIILVHADLIHDTCFICHLAHIFPTAQGVCERSESQTSVANYYDPLLVRSGRL